MDQGKLLQYDTPDEIVVRPATEFVGELLGSGERPFRLLSFRPVRDFVEPGEAPGAPIAEHDDAARCARGGAVDRPRRACRSPTPTAQIIGRVTLATAVRAGGAAAMKLGADRPASSCWRCWWRSSLTPQSFAFVFQPLTKNGQPAIYTQNSLLNLTLSHLLIVAIATVAATASSRSASRSW